jgi:NitT/TauT family transport system permease protein
MSLAARLWPPLALAAVLLLAWETGCRLFDIPAYFLPPPSAVAAALVEAAPRLVPSAGRTFVMALQALAAATIVGGGLAVLVSLSPTAERAARPLATALQVTPVVAIAPLVLIWYGLDNTGAAVVTLAALVAFFPIFSGVLTGLRSADPDLERLFDLYGADRRQRLVRLRAPSAGLSIIGAVVAEFVSGSGAAQGLAWRLLEAGNRLRTAELLAALAWLAVMGAALNAGAGLLVAVARRHLVGR